MREAAVDLIGRFVLIQPDLTPSYYQMLLERIRVSLLLTTPLSLSLPLSSLLPHPLSPPHLSPIPIFLPFPSLSLSLSLFHPFPFPSLSQ